MATAQGMRWDEPAQATSPRGWLMTGGTCAGFYLDYGPDHYRSPHDYCRPEQLCPQCQPGNVLAVRYPAGPGELAQTAAAAPTVRRAQVSWSRWDAGRMKTVTSHPWQYIVTEPDGAERCFDKRGQADAWIAENYPQVVAVR
jgi:hypothetical protein